MYRFQLTIREIEPTKHQNSCQVLQNTSEEPGNFHLNKQLFGMENFKSLI